MDLLFIFDSPIMTVLPALLAFLLSPVRAFDGKKQSSNVPGVLPPLWCAQRKDAPHVLDLATAVAQLV